MDEEVEDDGDEGDGKNPKNRVLSGRDADGNRVGDARKIEPTRAGLPSTVVHDGLGRAR